MNTRRFPNESDAYRAARNQLLQAEIDLRSQAEGVAAQRRALPLGGTLREDYLFDEMAGTGVSQVALSALFKPGMHSLFIYSFMSIG